MSDASPSHQGSEAGSAPLKTAEADKGQVATDSSQGNHKRSKALWIVTFAIFAVGIGWVLLWFFYFQYHESTDDAYANGNMINVNSVIPGMVTAFFADDTDLVIEGQLLVTLDRTQYELIYEEELADLAVTALNVRKLYDTVAVKQANVEGKRANVVQMRYDYDNRLQLVDSLAVSHQDFVQAHTSLSIAESDLQQAEWELQVARDLAGNTAPEHHPDIEQQKAAVRKAFYNLQHCAVYAPYTGYIAQRAAEVGQWTTPELPLMAIIPTEGMWVDANFKETQLTYMRIGQPATVWFDIYGQKVVYYGKVLGIASGTGSVFSLIPPQNATGNWIKIVQRLPVRISIDAAVAREYPLRLGLSANVDVDLTNQDLPRLAQIPSTKPVATTKVFDISFDQVDRTMDEVIRKILKDHRNEQVTFH